jgi:hypothetical protein
VAHELGPGDAAEDALDKPSVRPGGMPGRGICQPGSVDVDASQVEPTTSKSLTQSSSARRTANDCTAGGSALTSGRLADILVGDCEIDREHSIRVTGRACLADSQRGLRTGAGFADQLGRA